MKQKLKLLPLQMILAILPFLLCLRVESSGLGAYPWNSADDRYVDIFLQGKMVTFIALAAVLLCLTVYKLVNMDKQERKQNLLRFIPLLLYLFFVLLSTIGSENMNYSLWGAMDAKEPVTVLAGYVTVALYTYLIIDSVEDIRQLAVAAVAGGFCMAVLGVLQAIGKDPLMLKEVQVLFAGRKFMETYGSMKLSFPVGMAYGTLYNPNYVGTYVAMYAPLAALGLVLFQSAWKKVVCGGTCLGLLVMLFASQSRTGLISIAVVIIVAIIFFGKGLWKRWHYVVPAAVLAVAAFFIVDSQRDFLLTSRLKEMFMLRPSEDPVQGVDTTGDGVRVLYKNTEFTIKMPVSGMFFEYVVLEGPESKEVFYEENKSYGYFTLSNGDTIAIQTSLYKNNYAFGLNINGRIFYFTNQPVAGDYKYINERGRLDECVIPDNVFPGYEATASGRGYVWGRTIPLLRDRLVTGSGPDTFVLCFPQNDYVARYRCGFDDTIFTRPHNFYLQMGVQTGVLSLVSFLAFYVIYFVRSCVLYCFKKFSKQEEWMGFILFLSTVGFMAAGFANDSLIVVSPVFYVLLGAGMAVNNKFFLKRKEGK